MKTLREIARERNLKQRDVAKELGIGESAVSHKFSGRRGADKDFKRLVCKKLKITQREFDEIPRE